MMTNTQGVKPKPPLTTSATVSGH